MVRCIYRQAGTPLADDQDQSLVPDKEGMKELVDRYATRVKMYYVFIYVLPVFKKRLC